jgi:hypothetical protein
MAGSLAFDICLAYASRTVAAGDEIAFDLLAVVSDRGGGVQVASMKPALGRCSMNARLSCSSRMQLMSLRRNKFARVRPAGPAPTTTTCVRMLPIRRT